MKDAIERRWRVFVPLLKGDAAGFQARLAESEGDDAALLSFLRSQRLAATVAAAVEQSGLRPELTEELGDALKGQRRTQFLLAVRNLEAVVELHGWLDTLGVDHLFLKGPLLALLAHGGAERRTVGDIDVLVPNGSVDRVEAELLRRGYRVRYSTFAGRTLSRFFTHHFSYANAHQMVEVHWHLVREAGVRVDMARVWAEAESVNWRGTSLPVPSTETALLIQVLATAKDLELGTLPLRSFVDTRALVAMLEMTIDWDAFFGRMEQQGAGRLAPVVFELLFRMMECREEFPRAAEATARRMSTISSLDPADPTLGLRVFGLRAPARENKQRLFPLHRGGALVAWAWWAISLRFRRAVYSES